VAGHGRRDTDDVLLLALATGLPIALAAEKAGISARTARRRLSDAAFRNRVHETRIELVRGAIGRLAGLGRRAAGELNRLIKSGKSDQVRLGAAKAALQFMLSGYEGETLAQEVEGLAEQIRELKAAAEAERFRPRHARAEAPPSDNGEPEPDAAPPRLFFSSDSEEPFPSGA
jgi:hypothetical protein